MSRRRVAVPLLASLAVAGAVAGTTSSNAASPTTCPAPPALSFAEPKYVDMGRAGGEPIVFTYPDGTLLYGAHAGSTHFYTPAAGDPDTGAFAENYQGQTYYWFSDTDGGEWAYVNRTLPPDNAPLTGFSDPEFAYDLAGNVYVSEINLVNVALSKSTDGGRSYVLQNPTTNIFTDRQWTEGDEEDVVYLVSNPTGPGGTYAPGQVGYQPNSGHTMYKSVDGGKTWTNGFPDPGGLGDIRVDKRNGTVYEAHLNGSELSIAAFRDARNEDFTTKVDPEMNVVDDDVHMIAHWPAFDLDPSGNLYITWDENGNGDREAGIYYSYSKDAGKTWAKPIRVDADEKTSIWPWLGVGDDGRVGIAWLEADVELPGNDAETAGTHGWRIVGATSITGLGCAGGKAPSFSRAVMTPEAIHQGTICQGGTTCQATATDRRLGDYFSVDVDNDGMLYAGYSDTRQGGAVSLPAFVRQSGGAPLVVQRPGGNTGGGNTGGGNGGGNTGGNGGTRGPGTTPATGLPVTLPALAAAAAVGAVLVARRRRRAESA
ncbi:MAG TPA: hypothetical protein VGX28_13040 [Frankiaceae bacterium]|nr:hypothetical protein [Frankiaceae bacterium]